MKRLLVLTGLLLTACQSSSTSSLPAVHTPFPAPSASPHELLFAVLEKHGGPSADTVAIVGLDGVARAKATFAPRQVAYVGNAAPLLQPEARVAAGLVYYSDGQGVLRSLTPAGQVVQVATFSITARQQELAYAISPDGKRLLASLLTLPATTPPDPNGPSWPGFDPNGHWTLDLLSASPGGSAQKVSHQDLGTQYPRDVLQVVGWDEGGPLATLNTDLGTQQPSFSPGLFGSPLVHLDQNGTPGPALAGTGPPGCMPLSVLPDESLVCSNNRFQALSVRNAAGAVIWALKAGDNALQPTLLSPDATMIAGGGRLLKKDGSAIDLPVVSEGWLDSQTIIGTLGQSGNLALVKVSDPGHAIDLGFKGSFVDVVTRP